MCERFPPATGLFFFLSFYIDLNQQLKRGVGATLGGCGVTHWSLRTSSQWTVPETAFQSGRASSRVRMQSCARSWRHLQSCLFFFPPPALSRLLCHYKGANRSQNYRSKNTGLSIYFCVVTKLQKANQRFPFFSRRVDPIKMLMLWRRTLTCWRKMPKHTMNQDLRFSK